MAFELEALVGHLFVVGGRTIKTTPPGALCEVAPKKAARGRELDTFFILVLPAGNVAPNTFYEQMALMAAERYFSNTGSVTSALRDVFNTLNSNLFEHNVSGRKRYEAHMMAAVMRGKDLYVGRAGAATLILRHNAETKTVPDSLSDDAKLFKPSLGVQPIPEVEMSRFTLESGTRMLFADASIREISPEKLTHSLLARDIEQVLDELKLLVTLQIQLMAIEFVPPEQPALIPAVTGQSSAVLLAEIAAARAKTATQTTVAVSEDTESEALATSPRPKRATAQNRLKKRSQESIVTVARSTGNSLTRVGTLAAKLFGSEGNAKQRRRNATLIAIAVVLIPTVIIAIVMLSWVGNVGQTAYEECVQRATDGANVARTVPSENRVSVIAAWNTTLQIIGECQDLRPEFSDPTLITTRIEGQTAIDALSSITRRSTNTIWSAPEGANIREILLQGLDLYALDSTRSVVYRVQLGENGLASIGFQPLQFMSAGVSLDGSVVGRLIGIAIDDTRIVAIDEGGQLIICRPLSINNCNIQQLPRFEDLRNPIRVAIWQNQIYVLDIGSEQIWKFSPIGNTETYSLEPTEYFSTGQRPANLANAVDFAIGSGSVNGNVFILYGNGTMTRHFGSESLVFSFSGFPDSLEKPEVATTQGMFLNDSAFGTGFYAISRPTRTIYYTTAAGTFQNAFRVQDETQLERLNDVVADAEAGIIYVSSGNTIFAIRSE